LGASTVFVRGTRLESFGLSRVEAVLGGTPVVTTSSGETRYMRLYPYGDAEQLAAEVLSVVASPPDLREAREYYERLAEQAMAQVRDVYRRVGSA
jgi:glycosyltransferase involved in cell wall biosynthesis